MKYSFKDRCAMRRKVFGIAVGAAAVCGLVLATPASASIIPPGGGTWDHVWHSVPDSSGASGATLYVQEHGDVFELCDTRADGQAARVSLAWNGGSYGFDVGGYDTCGVETATDHDIPENYEVSVYVWSGAGADVYKTSFLNDH